VNRRKRVMGTSPPFTPFKGRTITAIHNTANAVILWKTIFWTRKSVVTKST
jgi:hypothetical protein